MNLCFGAWNPHNGSQVLRPWRWYGQKEALQVCFTQNPCLPLQAPMRICKLLIGLLFRLMIGILPSADHCCGLWSMGLRPSQILLADPSRPLKGPASQARLYTFMLMLQVKICVNFGDISVVNMLDSILTVMPIVFWPKLNSLWSISYLASKTELQSVCIATLPEGWRISTFRAIQKYILFCFSDNKP